MLQIRVTTRVTTRATRVRPQPQSQAKWHYRTIRSEPTRRHWPCLQRRSMHRGRRSSVARYDDWSCWSHGVGVGAWYSMSVYRHKLFGPKWSKSKSAYKLPIASFRPVSLRLTGIMAILMENRFSLTVYCSIKPCVYQPHFVDIRSTTVNFQN